MHTLNTYKWRIATSNSLLNILNVSAVFYHLNCSYRQKITNFTSQEHETPKLAKLTENNNYIILAIQPQNVAMKLYYHYHNHDY